jgi:TPR repeat protein
MKQAFFAVLCFMGCVMAHAGAQEEALKANTKADFARELSITRPLADKGQAWAQSLLGDSYAFGAGVLKDDAEALKWYQLAAAQGDASAQNNLGSMYGKGLGVAQDMVHAHMWTQLAAANGATLAAMNMGILAQHMTREQISMSQTLARECLLRHFKACD